MTESQIPLQPYIPTEEDIKKHGVQVNVGDSTEKWSEFLLDDGSKIRVKASVLSAIRIDGKYDDQGNPVYVLNLSPSIVTIPAEELKRKD